MQYKRLLMIDDDPDDRLLFMETVEEIDPSLICTTAENGLEAIRYLKDGGTPKPDIIFLDLNMPLMDGKECLKKLRQIDELTSVPVIMYTTSNLQQEIDETKKLGANYFLTKPVNVRDIKIALEFVLSAKW